MKESTAEQITWSCFIRLIRRSIVPELGSKALLLAGLLILMLLGINGLNVLNSYVGRNFMTAIEGRDLTEFFNQGGIYIGVFALSSIVAVLSRFAEERLGLLWRERLTKRLVGAYLGDRTYHTLKVTKRVENPDERITDDVRAFTTTTLSFSLMILNSTLTVIAFSSVMLSISETLFLVAVLYAVGGTLFSIFLGRPLVRLNSAQLDKEANFRADLIHVREHAEAIALSRREGRLLQRLRGRVDDLVGNLGSIISSQSKPGLFQHRIRVSDPDHSGSGGRPVIYPWRGGVRRHHAILDGVLASRCGFFFDHYSVSIHCIVCLRGLSSGYLVGGDRETGFDTLRSDRAEGHREPRAHRL
jgi:putative ATP-binding cassette transporter